MSELYLGVDAGNSKTVALVCDRAGQVVGYARTGNGDIYGAASAEAAVEAVLGAVKSALTMAGAPGAEVVSAAFRLAGVDWPEDHAFWVKALARRAHPHQVDPAPTGFARRAHPHLPDLGRISIANDGFAAIRCGEPSGIGVAVVDGTGSAVAGRGPEGAEWSMSFWIQDAHGAGGLVSAALRAVYRAELGLAPPTSLTARLLTFFGQGDVEAMLHALTRREGGAGYQQASAARQVAGAALDGDEVALAIVHAHGEHLADYARVTAQRVGFRPGVDGVPVVLAGSVLCAEKSPVAAALVAALAARFPEASPRLARLSPVSGAALDALAEGGVPLTPGVLDRLVDTAPPPDFLLT
ncbi:N-acetylglucosamine kinase [Actinopolymorpha alba]|uniref:N-acetylglucosamine kinase n=1 Tax=Actinopolymorpha alba TaxID=533267 RepID=UPI000369AD6F|nr:BadF/BadG/BcrA/BcrD ATPase family protein [Actinopolymorpha alba]